MKKSGKRILSFILTAVMIFALLPVFGKPMVVKAENPQGHVHDNQDTNGSLHSGWKEISTWKELEDLGKTGGSGYLVNDIEISETWKVDTSNPVNLCLNGYSILQIFGEDTISVNGTLNLYDSESNSGKITHSSKILSFPLGSGVKIINGTFTMYGGTISGNNSTQGGVNNQNGTFTMYGGTISGNEGCGVYNCHKFIMHGGIISGTKSTNGGGVCNDNEFTMYGGTISGNEAKNMGGGVLNNYVFTMEGGTISGNKSENGGGVYNEGTFTMNGGIISGNEAKLKGGGVFNNNVFTMEGGKISGNGNENYVGFYNDGNATLNGGYFLDSTNGFDSRTVTITFDSNDGSNKTITQYVPENKEIFLAPNQFTYDHKRFEGWNTERDGSGKPYKDNDKIKIDKNLKLYAQRKDVDIISYDVNFVVNNGSWSDGTNDKKTVTVWRYEDEDKTLILKDTDIPSLGNPNTGYKTGKWETDPDTDHTVTSNITYTYNFEPIGYTIKFDPNGAAGTIDDQSRTYDDKAPLTTNTFTLEGQTFNGWNTAADGSGTHFKDKEVNNLSSTEGDTVTLYAQWTTNTYTVSWKDYDGTVLETDTDVAYGSTPSYDGETPKRDDAGNIEYTFSGWTPAIDIVKGAATYTATYSENEIIYTVTFDTNGGKADVTTGATNAEFKLSSLPTPTYEGYKFKGWFTEATGGSEISADTVYTQDTTIYAQWEKVEEPEEPTAPEEPTEPEVPEITEPEPEPEIPEKDWLDDLRLKLQIANELGGPQTVEYSGDFALSYDIMQYLVEHPDITFVYHVTYEGQEYTITIPAGKAIADSNIPWYGPLWLLANYGGENVPDIIAGSSRYTVVAGDTLSGIAEKFNTTVEELAKKNGIKNPDYIIVGQVIVY